MNARWGAALLLLALVGCGQHAANSPIVLRVATWGSVEDDSNYAKTLDGIYKEFEKENPGITLQIEITPDLYPQKMVMNHAAGVDPDVMTLDDANCAVFINNGLVKDLTPFLANDTQLKLEDFYPNAVGTYKRDAAQYAIPIDFTPMVMYYNKRLFDAAQVPYPDGSWNFDQFRETAKRLTQNGEYGFVVTTWMPAWVMWLWNNGGDVLSADLSKTAGTFDSDQNAKTLAYLRDLVEVDHSSPSPSQAAAMGIDYFAQGKAAMTITGHWSMVDYAKTPGWDNLGVTVVPHNGPQVSTPLYEAGYSIPVGCPHPALAWKFIKYMTSARVQFQYNSSGIAIDARKDVSLERAKKPIESQFLQLLGAGRTPYGAKVVAYDFVENQGLSAMSSILQNGVDPQIALTTAAQRIDLEFKKR